MTTLEYDLEADLRRRTARMAVREFLVLSGFLGSLFGLLILAHGVFG